MSLSDLSIKKPVFTWMCMIAILFFGGISYKNLGVSELPDVDFPVVNISVFFDGAASEVIEKDIIEPIEDVLLSIPGIISIDSAARYSRANVTVEFDLEKDIDIALQEVQTQMARVQRRMPKNAEAPVISKSNPEDRPIMWIGVSSSKLNQNELMHLVRTQLQDRFTTIKGVSEVFLGGFVSPILRVDVSGQKLNQYSLTAQDVLSSIQQEHIELPAGRIENAKSEQSIRVIGELKSAQDFANLYIKKRGGSPNYSEIQVKDVANVYDGLEDIRRISRVNSESAISMGIRKQRGVNSVQVAKSIKEKISEVQKQFGDKISIGVNFDSTKFIEESVHELVFTLIIAAILTALVCWLFLGSFSSTLNISLAIPVSILGTFIALDLLNFTLNTFTLLALSLAIGLVVDDAIIVLENIVRHFNMKKSRIQASLDGSKEILFAVLATSLALIAIFIPVAFMDGVIGRYFYQFGLCISIAVAISTYEALSFAPMRCSQFLDSPERSSRFGKAVDRSLEALSRYYEKSLNWSIAHKKSFLAFSVLFFLLSLALFPKLQKELSPAQDQSTLSIRFKTPLGSSLQYTSEQVKPIEDFLAKQEYIERYLVSVGGNDVNTAQFFVSLKEKKKRPINPATQKNFTQSEIEQIIRDQFKNMKTGKLNVQSSSGGAIGGRGGYVVEFAIRGPDWETLVGQAELMEALMKQSEKFQDINMDDLKGAPELRIIPNRQAAQRMGVEIAEISKAIEMLYGGAVAGLYTKEGQRYDIRVQLNPEAKTSLDSLKYIVIRNTRGELIDLKNLVRVENKFSPPSITRTDRSRSIRISANPVAGVSQEQALKFVEDLAAKNLQTSYYLAFSGSGKSFKDSFASLYMVLALGLLVAYMVLGSQFNSFYDPILVFAALPFALSGAFISLLISSQSLNMYSFIGIILLIGIAKKNSILLVEFANQVFEQENLPTRTAAIAKAAPMRLRPILMTSLSCIAAAIPGAINFGPGAETRVPMSVVIVGGVLLSTLFTLYVVPCLYSLRKT